MKLTVIGHWGAYPEAGGANSSFLLQEENFSLLIDCGSGVLSQLQHYLPLEQLNAAFISHYHQDHVADVGVLQYAIMVSRQLGKKIKTLPIYAHDRDSGGFSSLTFRGLTQGIAVRETEEVGIGPWRVRFNPTTHSAFCLAARFEGAGKTLVYTADTAWQDSLVAFAQGADLLIAESNLYDEQQGTVPGHMTAGEAGRLAKEAGVRQLLLTHLPHHGQHDQLLEQAQKQFAGPVHLARPGLTLSI